MDRNELLKIELYTKNLLGEVQHCFDLDTINGIEHYIDNSEIEMAFEGLMIEIMNLNNVPKINILEIKEIAIQLKLDKESVFDSDFWSKLENWTALNG